MTHQKVLKPPHNTWHTKKVLKPTPITPCYLRTLPNYPWSPQNIPNWCRFYHFLACHVFGIGLALFWCVQSPSSSTSATTKWYWGLCLQKKCFVIWYISILNVELKTSKLKIELKFSITVLQQVISRGSKVYHLFTTLLLPDYLCNWIVSPPSSSWSPSSSSWSSSSPSKSPSSPSSAPNIHIHLFPYHPPEHLHNPDLLFFWCITDI